MAQKLLGRDLTEQLQSYMDHFGQCDFYCTVLRHILNGSFSGMHGMGGLFYPGLLSHCCDLSPLGTDLEVDILLRATMRGGFIKWALKSSLALYPRVFRVEYFSLFFLFTWLFKKLPGIV